MSHSAKVATNKSCALAEWLRFVWRRRRPGILIYLHGLLLPLRLRSGLFYPELLLFCSLPRGAVLVAGTRNGGLLCGWYLRLLPLGCGGRSFSRGVCALLWGSASARALLRPGSARFAPQPVIRGAAQVHT